MKENIILITSGTQLQRQIELEVRKQKDIQIGAVSIGDKEMVEQAQKRITQLTRKYKEIADISGLPTKLERMRVSRIQEERCKKNVILHKKSKYVIIKIYKGAI